MGILEMDYHGVHLAADDFPRDLRGWVAFNIAFAANTRCRDKEAALELLLSEADEIIARVQSGRAPQQKDGTHAKN